MSEGFSLEPVARGVLLPQRERIARIERAIPQMIAAVESERDEVCVEATLACLLYDTLPHASWCGFYRRTGPRELTVGPYQGAMGCLRIAFERGVCGACARTGQRQRVPDVRRFEGHIACDARTLSELVLPVFDGAGSLRAVLDLDALELDAFSDDEADLLEALLRRAFSSVVWP